MTRRKPIKFLEENWPAHCCGVCLYSDMDEKQLMCYALPPTTVLDEDGGEVSVRGAAVEATDKECHLFKPKSMA